MKKISIGLLMVFIAAVVGVSIYLSTPKETTKMPDIMLANIEALAQGEGSSSCGSDGIAYTTCPIWNIRISFAWNTFGSECITGGSYKCNEGTCPHGK